MTKMTYSSSPRICLAEWHSRSSKRYIATAWDFVSHCFYNIVCMTLSTGHTVMYIVTLLLGKLLSLGITQYA